VHRTIAHHPKVASTVLGVLRGCAAEGGSAAHHPYHDPMPRRVMRTDLPPEPDAAAPADHGEEPPPHPHDDAPALGDEGEDRERRPPTNSDLARIFHTMGDILEVKGEIPFKTVAYHRAADAIARAPFDVAATYATGDRRPIPGVGQAIGDKIVELSTTGHMAAYERLR